MLEMPDNLNRIERMSWDSLREKATKELATIPARERIVFEKLFQRKWPEFCEMILSLAGKSYDQISPIHERMAMLGDLSQAEVMELTIMTTLNKTQYKSAKIEYYQVCRFLHTKEK